MDGSGSVAFYGKCREECFKTAMVAADALRAVRINGEMADVAGNAADAAKDLAVEHDSAADASTESEHDGVLAITSGTPLLFASHGDTSVVVCDDRALCRENRREQLRELLAFEMVKGARQGNDFCRLNVDDALAANASGCHGG